MFTFCTSFNHIYRIPLIFIFVNFFYIANAKTIKIATVDTGFDFNSTWADVSEYGLIKPKLCPEGHKNFVEEGLPLDTIGHGTHVAGLIAKYAKNSDYCLIIIKYYSYNSPGFINLKRSIEALKWAVKQNVDVVNYSGGGPDYYSLERKVIEEGQFKGIKFIVAAGNDGKTLDKEGLGKDASSCSYYPACYNALISPIGAVDAKGQVLPTSNRGNAVKAYREGLDVLSLLPNNSYGKLTGSSQATAIFSGEYVKLLDKYAKLATKAKNKYLKSNKTIIGTKGAGEK